MKALRQTSILAGLLGLTCFLSASPASAQIFRRRVVVVSPGYAVAPAYPVAVAPVTVTSGVVPAGYTTTTVTAPVPTVYSAPAVVAPVRYYRARPIRGGYRYYPY